MTPSASSHSHSPFSRINCRVASSLFSAPPLPLFITTTKINCRVASSSLHPATEESHFHRPADPQQRKEERVVSPSPNLLPPSSHVAANRGVFVLYFHLLSSALPQRLLNQSGNKPAAKAPTQANGAVEDVEEEEEEVVVESGIEDTLPWKCPITQQPFESPVTMR